MSKSITTILLSFLAATIFYTNSFAQDEVQYPKNYFRNPLEIPIFLAGNFGECRPNHFHSGIDIKTNGVENQKVYAAADGFVSRIKMDKGGFGHAIYITHPEGFTTLYAHLNNFIPSLQNRMKKEQYGKEIWAVDFTLQPSEFPVKKGQQIAWSGNTGASTAPHLHFEIRDTKTEHPLNPMLFGLPIIDTRSPIPSQLSLYDMNQSIYNQQARYINLKKSGSVYTADTIDIATDKLGLGINVNDYMNGSDNTLNFYTAAWYLDGEQQGSIRLDNIGYEETRYLHAYIDYKSKKQNGNWYQLLFELPGNFLNHIYPKLNSQKGILNFADALPHEVTIELKDAMGNTTNISFCVKFHKAALEENCETKFMVNKINNFDDPNVKFTLSDKDLYDDICFSFTEKSDANSLSNHFTIGNSFIPLHKYFELKVKPNKPVGFSDRDKVVLMYSGGKSKSGQSATFHNGWYNASVRSFGEYWLVTDNDAPVIKALQKENANLSKAKNIGFSVKEDVTSVKDFRAELDGKWLSFEPRGDNFFYTFDEHCSKGKHKLVVTVKDENDNSKTVVFNFTR